MTFKWKIPQRGQGLGRPLMTAKELADEFGVSVHKFGSLLGNYNGPKQKTNNRGSGTSFTNSYFDPVEVRRWWVEVKKKETENETSKNEQR